MKKTLTLAIAAMLFTCSVASAETLRTGPGNVIPQVYDSQGRRLGPMISANVLLMQIKGRWFGLSVGRSGFYSNGSVNMVFESSDCTGTPYMNPRSDSLIEENYVVTPERYLVFPSKNLVHMTVNSTMPCTDPMPYLESSTATPSQCSPIANPVEMDAAPMEVMDLLSITMRPPFSFR